jgi:hypothetical protein
LALVVSITPPGRISWFGRGLKLDKGPRRRALPDECKVGPPDTRIAILGHYNQPLREGQEREKPFEQLLESRRERRFRNVGISSSKLPDTAGVDL